MTLYSRDELLVENSKLTHISRVLCRAIEHSVDALDTSKYGNLDKKLFKECSKIIKETVNVHASGVVALVSVVSEICGILLNCCLCEIRQNSNEKTLHMKHIKLDSVYHTTSDGARLPFSSLMQFIKILQTFEPQMDRPKESLVCFE